MTEAEWQACADPTPMLEFLRATASDRKLRLFACGCCRSVWDDFLTDVHREAIPVAERHADGRGTAAELGTVVSAVHRTRRKRAAIDLAVYSAVRHHDGQRYHGAESVAHNVARVVAKAAAPDPSPTFICYHNGERYVEESPPPNADRLIWEATVARVRRSQADLLREIVGNPFTPYSFPAEWRTEAVVGLAAAINELRAFDRLPILADAVQEAGCDDAHLLSHCRGAAPHALGCWAIDAILGKS